MNIALGAVLLAAFAVWAYRRNVPIRGLGLMEQKDLPVLVGKNSKLQLLDVRDYMEFENCHYPGAIGLPLGRLRFFWQRSLDKDRPVVLISSERTDAYLAARYLRRKGIYTQHWVLQKRCGQQKTCSI